MTSGDTKWEKGTEQNSEEGEGWGREGGGKSGERGGEGEGRKGRGAQRSSKAIVFL